MPDTKKTAATSPHVHRRNIVDCNPTKLTATEFRPLVKGKSLRGFFSIITPSGLVIKDCAYHISNENGRRWISVPARQYDKPNGEKSWIPIVDFVDKETRYAFQDDALEAVDTLLASLPPEIAA